LYETVADARNSLTWHRERFYDSLHISWSITLADEDQMIGGIRYCGFMGYNSLIGEVSYELAPAHWGRGLMAEALGAVVDFGFARLGLNRVQLTTHPENRGSARTAERAGFVAEGVLRQWMFNERTKVWEDRVLYARVRPEGDAR
jgi:ribosomal-protein-alanine N-acetyltransferase